MKYINMNLNIAKPMYLLLVLLLASISIKADIENADTTEPNYSTEKKNAIIYLYREELVTASDIIYRCFLNDEYVAGLVNGNYVRIVVRSGMYDYWVETVDVNRSITSRAYFRLDTRAGDVYYLKHVPALMKPGMAWKVAIIKIDNSIAKYEIMKLRDKSANDN